MINYVFHRKKSIDDEFFEDYLHKILEMKLAAVGVNLV
jgi:hypothetical protein